jgi:C-terminal processing protease CtpA/Prc
MGFEEEVRPVMRLLLLLFLPGCAFLAPKVNNEPPALHDMEEPLALHEEPKDEAERRALPSGSFTGVYVRQSAESLDQLGEAPEGVLVERVVENSPAHFAGLRKSDLIVEADGKPIGYRSEWRRLELETPPGSKLRIVYDRAGAEREVTLETVRRAEPADRQGTERFREEDQVGVVVRTATEVEARGAGLGPGGGAVVVGMARTSPWRAAGIVYGDLIVEIGGNPVDHPNVVLQTIRDAPENARIPVVFLRQGERREVEAPVSRRAQEQQIAQVPLLYYYEKDRDRKKFWVFFGAYKRIVTPAARETTVLWLFKFRRGDSDRLEEVSE